jgi:hypothetical protein
MACCVKKGGYITCHIPCSGKKRAGTLFAALHIVPLYRKMLIMRTKGKKLALGFEFICA